jgi:transcriptional regulator with XRE-family HTH domain
MSFTPWGSQPVVYGDALREARERAGFSRTQLARVCGLTAYRVRDFEMNIGTRWRADELARVSDALSVPPQSLCASVPDLAAFREEVRHLGDVLAALPPKRRAVVERALWPGNDGGAR